MTDRTVHFTVLGKPQPAGSKSAYLNPKTGKINVSDSNKKSRPWKQQVAGAAADQVEEVWTGPLALTVAFYVARPKGHYRTGRNAGLLRDSAPVWPTTKPDTTKLLRAVEDALIGVLYRDDAQVVKQVVSKHYADDVPERCVVIVSRLDEP
jgi:Holliday junction resolvase RusA-like endonuclease